MVKVSVTIMSAGYCLQNQSVALSGYPSRQIKFPALFALIEHPTAGLILYDTGYAPRFYQHTRRFPYKLYALLTPVFVTEGESAVTQLQARGIVPKDVDTVIVSHFHGDHVCGLHDFPTSKFVYFEESHTAVRAKRGLSAVRAAFLPGLLPDDISARSRAIPLASCAEIGDMISPFTHGVDLFGDGSVIGIHLPGHAVGQMGLLLQTESSPVFLVADACWHSDAYRLHVPPSRLGKFIQADAPAYMSTLDQLHLLHQRSPALPMLPSHCGDVYQTYVQGISGRLDAQ